MKTLNSIQHSNSKQIESGSLLTTIYHIAYEPSFKTATLHFWTQCNLHCLGCFCSYEQQYFNLFKDPVSKLNKGEKKNPPTRFLTIDAVISHLSSIDVKNILFMGTEPTLDNSLPLIAERLHNEFHTTNILMTNGLRLIDLSHIDTVLFGIKTFSEDIHIQYTGKSNRKILANFSDIHKLGKNISAISLLIPGFVENAEVEKIAAFISRVNPKIPFTIHSYFHVPGCEIRSALPEEIDSAIDIAKEHLENVYGRNLSMKRVGEPAVVIV